MNRRLFLQSASIAAAWSALCHAQKPDRIPVVGFLRAEAGLSESRPLTVQLDFYREVLRAAQFIQTKFSGALNPVSCQLSSRPSLNGRHNPGHNPRH